jgi:hypothetical protein
MFVGREQLQAGSVMEVGDFWYSAEASSLGMDPGLWPTKIETDLGNGQPFIREFLSEAGGEYRQGNGLLKLRIWND